MNEGPAPNPRDLLPYGIQDGEERKRQSETPCPSVYSPDSALGSLPSVAISSGQVQKNNALFRYSTIEIYKFCIENMMFLRFNDYNHTITDIFLSESDEKEVRKTEKRNAYGTNNLLFNK